MPPDCSTRSRAAGFTLFNGTATHPNVIIVRRAGYRLPASGNPVSPVIRLHDTLTPSELVMSVWSGPKPSIRNRDRLPNFGGGADHIPRGNGVIIERWLMPRR